MNYKNDRILRNHYYYNKRVRDLIDLTQEPNYRKDDNKTTVKLNIERETAISGPIIDGDEDKATYECADMAILIIKRLLKERG